MWPGSESHHRGCIILLVPDGVALTRLVVVLPPVYLHRTAASASTTATSRIALSNAPTLVHGRESSREAIRDEVRLDPEVQPPVVYHG